MRSLLVEAACVCLSQTIEQLDDPTQTIEVEQVLGCHCGRTLES